MYSREITETSKSALLELGLALYTYRNDIVLSGGWPPYFITENYFEHCGSVDIDLILKTTILPKYESIREIVTSRGYVEESPFQFARKMRSPVDGNYYPIRIDFLCDRCDLGFHGKIQPDLKAFMFDGADIAFDFNFEKEITTILPENGTDTTVFRVLNLTGSMILKGQALQGRRKEKDAYDIFALTHAMGGPLSAARYFNQNFSKAVITGEKRALARNSLAVIQRKFHDPASAGPFDVEKFSENRYKRSIVAAQVNKFLKNLEPV